jgi:hypothetical protein
MEGLNLQRIDRRSNLVVAEWADLRGRLRVRRRYALSVDPDEGTVVVQVFPVRCLEPVGGRQPGAARNQRRSWCAYEPDRRLALLEREPDLVSSLESKLPVPSAEPVDPPGTTAGGSATPAEAPAAARPASGLAPGQSDELPEAPTDAEGASPAPAPPEEGPAPPELERSPPQEGWTEPTTGAPE